MRSTTNTVTRLLILTLCFGAAVGCAGLPTLESPSVSVQTVRMLSSDALSPEFEVVLSVDNPNPIPLNISTITYDIRVEGESIVNGITDQISSIERYGSGQITISASPDLLTGARVIAQMLRSNRSALNYDLEAQIDIGRFLPEIKLTESGQLDLSH